MLPASVNLFESATTILVPLRTSASPTGSSPTLTSASSA